MVNVLMVKTQTRDPKKAMTIVAESSVTKTNVNETSTVSSSETIVKPNIETDSTGQSRWNQTSAPVPDNTKLNDWYPSYPLIGSHVEGDLVHNQILRSGQSINHVGGDLILTKSINAGAEAITDYSLHVYGSRRPLSGWGNRRSKRQDFVLKI